MPAGGATGQWEWPITEATMLKQVQRFNMVLILLLPKRFHSFCPLTLSRLTYKRAIGVYCSSGDCRDLHGRTISQGLHYVPGPDTCTLCVCDNSNPKWCKAVLCSPPQDCKSFRVGNSCCEFICLDDTLPKNSADLPDSGTDLGLRLIASAVTAILSLSLLIFLIHRLRQRKIRGRQNRQLSEDERSLGSIGYIAGSLAYLPGSMGYLGAGSQEHHIEFHYEEPASHYSLWKPPGNYFPRGEAPPPYEEAVAAARAEAALVAANNNNNNNTLNTSNNMGHTGGVLSAGTGHRTIPINLATSGSFRIEHTGVSLERESRTPLPNYDHSRPRSSEVTTEADILNTSESLRRTSRIMDVPAPLPMTEEEGAIAAIRSDAFYEDVLIGAPSSLSPVECYNPGVNASLPGKGAKNVASAVCTNITIAANTSPCAGEVALSSVRANASHESSEVKRLSGVGAGAKLNDLNKGSVESTESSQGAPLPSDEHDEDYRSECENCKSTHGSRYYLDQEAAIISSPAETMTLHRRPQEYDPEDPGYYRTSLTLPTNSRRLRTTPIHGTPAASLHGAARDNWFSSMPASSTSSTSSEEE
uniref:Integral membrane protein DGCR2/IDD n=1 Tax=Timema shepardi TaxID=629360 RepID=A0A7R9B159_TIMSH|nr:unnamed protein product [Timema shepardi]